MRSFSASHRAADVSDATSEPLDVLVIGAGATGAGVALDAASRGMSVAVVDKGDLASGTSSKSSKLIHGGLRYLEHGEVMLVREGVVERQLLMRLAPQLVRPMDFILPVWPDTARRRLLGVGLTTYDVLAGVRNVRRHDKISSRDAIALAPALDKSGLEYAYLYGDCATDDARLVLAVLRTAREHGATVLTYSEVTGLLWGSESELPRVPEGSGTTPRATRTAVRHARHGVDGKVIIGVQVTDRLTGQEYEVRARHVVNATGVWVDKLMGMADSHRKPAVQPSKGIHLTLPRERLPLRDATVIMPSRAGDGRVMFAIPWGRQTILGTTDTQYEGDVEALSIDEEDLEYVLRAGNAIFDLDLAGDDVIGGWVGVRPLLKSLAKEGSGSPGRGTAGSGHADSAPAGPAATASESKGSASTGPASTGSEPPSDMSRRHTLLNGTGGLVTITGGKLTTYRRMAEETVDLLVKRDGVKARCRTERIALRCAGPFDGVLARVAAAGAAVGLPAETCEMLARQYGDDALDVVRIVATEPGMSAPISPDTPHVLAEVAYAVREEGAVMLSDVLSRRTRVSLRVRDAGLPMAETAAGVMAAHLGHDEAWIAQQVAAYADGVRRERGVLGLPVPAGTGG